MEELVFAFPTDELWKLLNYKKKGLIRENSEILNRIVQNGLFLRRSELEENPSFKQIIPYAIISNKEPESPTGGINSAEFGKTNHFIYSRGHLNRQKKDYTINSL
jgi:hypothetical protein